MLIAYVDKAFFSSFAFNYNNGILQVDILGLYGAEFRDSNSCCKK